MVSLELEARLDTLLATAQAETADIDLFAPIAEREECPICLIPLPVKDNEIVFKLCCGKTICNGCAFKHMMTDINKKGPSHTWDDYKCAFCCQVKGTNTIKAMKKLMKKNNPKAFMQMANAHVSGNDIIQSDTKSLEMRICAAELGLANAFDHIGYSYEEGIVVEQDYSKALEFYEIGAKKSSVQAHRFLARFHVRNGNDQIGIKHLKIAASAGDKQSMNMLMIYYKDDLLSKEELAQTLRAFQTSNDAMKSKDRDEAKAMFDRYKNRD